MAQVYSERDRAAALAALQANGGNITRTAGQLGLNERTLRRWRDQHNDPDNDAPLKNATADELPNARTNLADRLRDFVHEALDNAPAKIGDANLQQLFTAVGISLEKVQLLEGKPTEIAKHEHQRTEVTERAAEAAATALRRRGLVN